MYLKSKCSIFHYEVPVNCGLSCPLFAMELELIYLMWFLL